MRQPQPPDLTSGTNRRVVIVSRLRRTRCGQPKILQGPVAPALQDHLFPPQWEAGKLFQLGLQRSTRSLKSVNQRLLRELLDDGFDNPS